MLHIAGDTLLAAQGYYADANRPHFDGGGFSDEDHDEDGEDDDNDDDHDHDDADDGVDAITLKTDEKDDCPLGFAVYCDHERNGEDDLFDYSDFDDGDDDDLDDNLDGVWQPDTDTGGAEGTSATPLAPSNRAKVMCANGAGHCSFAVNTWIIDTMMGDLIQRRAAQQGHMRGPEEPTPVAANCEGEGRGELCTGPHWVSVCRLVASRNRHLT